MHNIAEDLMAEVTQSAVDSCHEYSANLAYVLGKRTT